MLEKNYKMHCSLNNMVSWRSSPYTTSMINNNDQDLILFFFAQMVDADFDIKENVQKILTDSGYDKKRARTMDIDDFLE